MVAKRFFYVCVGLLCLAQRAHSQPLVGMAGRNTWRCIAANDGATWTSDNGAPWSPNLNLLANCRNDALQCDPKGQVVTVFTVPDGAMAISSGGMMIHGQPGRWACGCDGFDLYALTGIDRADPVVAGAMEGDDRNYLILMVTQSGEVYRTAWSAPCQPQRLGNIFGGATNIPGLSLGSLKARWR